MDHRERPAAGNSECTIKSAKHYRTAGASCPALGFSETAPHGAPNAKGWNLDSLDTVARSGSRSAGQVSVGAIGCGKYGAEELTGRRTDTT